MTQTQADELGRAINRATDYGIEVVAKGRRKKDNARIFCTNSHSDESPWHVVAVVGRRLVCDCKRSRSGHICTHRAAVHMELSVEAYKRIHHADMVEREMIRESETRQAAQTVVKAQVRGVNDTRPISIFKC